MYKSIGEICGLIKICKKIIWVYASMKIHQHINNLVEF